MAQTNTAEQMEMAFMEDGGLQDDGAMQDAVSGNEVPSGSMDQEVRDDVPAMLSEGEYVVPADVVRFHGVKLFEDLRMEAKMGMGRMESEGRIGGEPIEEDMDDELPFDISELQIVSEPVKEMAEGGEVGPTFTYNPNTRYMERQRATSGFDMRVYINPATGRQITIPFFNGQPMSAIPEGFVLASDQTAAQQTTAQPEAPVRNTENLNQGFIPSAPSQFGFDAFTTEDWANYVKQADGQLAAFTANIPILGTLQRLSESSAKAYAEKALETGKHPATGADLTTEEKAALQSVLNSSITERKSILESIGDLFKGEPDQNMSPRPDYAKPSLDPYNEAAARLAQEQGTDDMVETASSDTSTMGAIMAGVNRDKSGDTVGQKFASRADVMSDANDPFMSRMSLEDRLISYEGDYDYQSKNKNETVNGSQVTAYTRDDGVRMYIPFKDGETKDGRQLWTVGLGHQLSGDELDADGMPVKDAYEESLVLENFKKDVADSVASVPSVLKDPTKHHPRVQEAVAEMIFQMGLGNYQEKTGVLGFHNMIAALNLDDPDYRVARKEALDSDWANQTSARANDVAAAIAKGKFFADNALFETPSSRRIQGTQGGAAIPYTTDAAGFAGDIPPPVASPVTPSFVEGMDAVPQAGEATSGIDLRIPLDPKNYGEKFINTKDKGSVREISGSSRYEGIPENIEQSSSYEGIPPTAGPKGYEKKTKPPYRATGSGVQDVTPQGESQLGWLNFPPEDNRFGFGSPSSRRGGAGRFGPVESEFEFGGQPPQNLSNRAMARKDVTRAQGVPPIATEGGFPPLGTTQAGPTVATTQGLQPPQATTFDAPMIEPSASDLLKYEPKGDPLPSSKVGGAGRFPNIAQPTISDSQLTLGSPITKAQMPQALNTQTEQVFDPREATFTDAIKGAYKAAPSEEEVNQTNLDAQEDKAISAPKNFKPKIVFGASSLARGNSDAARKNQHRNFDGSGIALTQYGSVQFHPTERAGGGPSKPDRLDIFRFRVDGERQKFIRRYELEKILGKNFTTADIMAFDPTKWKRRNTGEKNLFGVDVGELVALDAPPKGLASKKSLKKQENINKQIKKAQEAYDATADYKKKAAIDTSYGGLGKKKAKELGITGYGGGRATGGLVKRRATKKKNT